MLTRTPNTKLLVVIVVRIMISTSLRMKKLKMNTRLPTLEIIGGDTMRNFFTRLRLARYFGLRAAFDREFIKLPR